MDGKATQIISTTLTFAGVQAGTDVEAKGLQVPSDCLRTFGPAATGVDGGATFHFTLPAIDQNEQAQS